MAFDVGGGSQRGVRPSMNVTPLVDVVLVLLIIFMVMTPMLTRQLPMQVTPKAEEDQAPPPADAPPPVVLSIGVDGQARINGEVVEAGQVVARLQRALNARPDKVVFFDAPDEVPYGKAIALLDTVKGGGIEGLSLLGEPLD